MTLENSAATLRELAASLAQDPREQVYIEAALMSVASAMQRVATEDREELQKLVAEFIADPEDKAIIKRLGALLRAAGSRDH